MNQNIHYFGFIRYFSFQLIEFYLTYSNNISLKKKRLYFILKFKNIYKSMMSMIDRFMFRLRQWVLHFIISIMYFDEIINDNILLENIATNRCKNHKIYQTSRKINLDSEKMSETSQYFNFNSWQLSKNGSHNHMLIHPYYLQIYFIIFGYPESNVVLMMIFFDPHLCRIHRFHQKNLHSYQFI